MALLNLAAWREYEDNGEITLQGKSKDLLRFMELLENCLSHVPAMSVYIERTILNLVISKLQSWK